MKLTTDRHEASRGLSDSIVTVFLFCVLEILLLTYLLVMFSERYVVIRGKCYAKEITFLSVCMSVCLSACLSVCPSVGNVLEL